MPSRPSPSKLTTYLAVFYPGSHDQFMFLPVSTSFKRRIVCYEKTTDSTVFALAVKYSI